MLTTHAVGIDLGTTYSCIAYLNEHGQPVTLSNQEGELATPSVVMFDDGGEVIVGTEALRNAILRPDRVVQNAKRFMGDPKQKWTIGGKPYTPTDVSAFVLKKLIASGQEQIGAIDQAVITVPAQFSDAQRHATVEAGHRAGLQRVDIINEPVAAALCHVLGSEGIWFDELANEQRIMVYDLGGGTFDLSLVRYRKNEVSVIASSGDLNLGGIDWNNALLNAIANQFAKEFHADPRQDASSMQALTLEVEQTKRSLTVRPRAALTVQHAGHRKTYQVELAQFEKLAKPLVDRTIDITQRMLKDNNMGWAHVDVVLTTGGSSRMPMVRESMKKLSGRTLNTSLSPDLSIAHGATYYAGMLLTNSKFARSILNEKAQERLAQVKQRSVNARALGILVRDMETNDRVPHYLVAANTPLPAAATQHFGTVVPGQKRVHLQIVESGTAADKSHTVLGACVIDNLPDNLPEGSEIAVTIKYDESARVHVSAKDVTSGKEATTEIIRSENLVPQLGADHLKADDDIALMDELMPSQPAAKPAGSPLAAKPAAAVKPPVAAAPPVKSPAIREAPRPRPVPAPPMASAGRKLDDADRPVPLCNECGEPLDARGVCAKCTAGTRAVSRPGASRPPAAKPAARPTPAASASAIHRAAAVPPPIDDEIIELDDSAIGGLPAKPGGAAKPVARPAAAGGKPVPPKPASVPRPQPASAIGSGKKPAQEAPAAKKPTVRPLPGPGSAPAAKPAPAPRKPGGKDPTVQGEEEFWQMVDE